MAKDLLFIAVLDRRIVKPAVLKNYVGWVSRSPEYVELKQRNSAIESYKLFYDIA